VTCIYRWYQSAKTGDEENKCSGIADTLKIASERLTDDFRLASTEPPCSDFESLGLTGADAGFFGAIMSVFGFVLGKSLAM
jgi:hypothetical protein